MLLINTKYGLYCQQADVYIDPIRGVNKAIITHAHSDHARYGSDYYLAHTDSANILKLRLGKNINLETKNYNEAFNINGVEISLHPAGHIIGSAQVRLAYNNQVWVVTGDYKIKKDGISQSFEPVPCTHFVTESTFGLPIYQFNEVSVDVKAIQDWVLQNHSNKLSSVLIGYSLGKAQRLINIVRDLGIRINVHSNIFDTNTALNFSNQNVHKLSANGEGDLLKNSIIIIPPGSSEARWLQKAEPYRTAVCSGWMHVRAWRTRSNVDQGFAISDHADWPGLLQAVEATGAENVYVTHGSTAELSQYLRETKGLNAQPLEVLYEGGE